jgi:hypothetical protein
MLPQPSEKQGVGVDRLGLRVEQLRMAFEPKDYVLDPQTAFWHRPDAGYEFPYSDGDDAEAHIERCTRETGDLASGSVELCMLCTT